MNDIMTKNTTQDLRNELQRKIENYRLATSKKTLALNPYDLRDNLEDIKKFGLINSDRCAYHLDFVKSDDRMAGRTNPLKFRQVA